MAFEGDVSLGDGEDPFSQPAPKKPVPVDSDDEAPAPKPQHHYDTSRQDDIYEEDIPQEAPAVASSSSMKETDDDEPEKSDFAFRVCEPRMTMPDSAIDLAYWTYYVNTKTNLPGWAKELKESRRFSDFIWLRDELCNEYPGAIIPPLPEKNVKGHIEKVLLTNVDLLSYRQRALTKFLNAVGRHHLAKSSAHLKAFCELDHAAFEAYKSQAKKTTASTNPGVVQKGKEGWFKMFKRGKDEASANIAPGDAELQAKKQYAKDMEECLSTVHDKLKKHIENRSDTSKAMGELSSYLVSTGELECQADAVLGEDLKNSGTYTTSLGQLQQEQANKERLLVLEVIGYYIGLFCAVKEEIRRVQRLGVTMCTFADELESCEVSLRKAAGEKKAKAEHNKEITEAKYKESKAKYEKAVALFNTEWDAFHQLKKKDMKNVQRVFVELQISYARQQENLQHAPIQPAVFTSE
ncbi:Sorting nexin 2A [Diplonema papillatum]|nr:Sorting nexin 2A [Diplonema papillatum]